jgi:hypothetical protein
MADGAVDEKSPQSSVEDTVEASCAFKNLPEEIIEQYVFPSEKSCFHRLLARTA